MLYVRLLKALCGMLRAALLFYKRLRKDLENMGFKINPYNPCRSTMHRMLARWQPESNPRGLYSRYSILAQASRSLQGKGQNSTR